MQTPYFGGDKICEADQQAREFNPKDLVCGRCCDLTGINECPDHGREYMYSSPHLQLLLPSIINYKPN
jgi:hypothetical protein